MQAEKDMQICHVRVNRWHKSIKDMCIYPYNRASERLPGGQLRQIRASKVGAEKKRDQTLKRTTAQKKGISMDYNTKEKLAICDRCGAMAYGEYIGCAEARQAIYRPPKDWQWHYQVGQLCPECNKQYMDFLDGFMQREKK